MRQRLIDRTGVICFGPRKFSRIIYVSRVTSVTSKAFVLIRIKKHIAFQAKIAVLFLAQGLNFLEEVASLKQTSCRRRTLFMSIRWFRHSEHLISFVGWHDVTYLSHMCCSVHTGVICHIDKIVRVVWVNKYY